MIKNGIVLAFAFLLFSGCFSYASAQTCAGENGVSDGVCNPAPSGPGELAGQTVQLEERLRTLLGGSAGASINSFVRTFDSSPTPVQRFALRMMAGVVSQGSSYDDFDVGNLRNITTTLRAVRTEFNSGFSNLPCASALGTSALDQYTDYSQALFIEALQGIDPDEFMEGRVNSRNIRRTVVTSVCAKLSEAP